MLMYALHLVLGAPFDFTSCDFPNIRRWLALILLENFGVVSESAETLQESLPCEEQATLSSSEAELPIIRHMKEAVKWLHSNSHLLRGPVEEPLFIRMNEDHKEKARNNLLEQSEASREPFLFHFVFRDDMELFLQECNDKMGLRVNSSFDTF
ncbi:structural maintenance of chromosomes protein 5-like [Xyrauchen texanus]|uniref:structural maintenance of chromosomes protein 5-like n=1 Tax=Xyrauchen texanus TaxID=154827 RepID=UPI002241A304|nr:structural maintenance of chromosomes protein 5-like [Xyrauchen texanus]